MTNIRQQFMTAYREARQTTGDSKARLGGALQALRRADRMADRITMRVRGSKSIREALEAGWEVETSTPQSYGKWVPEAIVSKSRTQVILDLTEAGML